MGIAQVIMEHGLLKRTIWTFEEVLSVQVTQVEINVFDGLWSRVKYSLGEGKMMLQPGKANQKVHERAIV